jgi:hypothetical protein
VLFAAISFSKAFFSKIWQELPLVALPNQEKKHFAFKRISASITARNNGLLKKIKISFNIISVNIFVAFSKL